jgi:Cu(I)/Ag(I) efflux system membrane fusion protein
MSATGTRSTIARAVIAVLLVSAGAAGGVWWAGSNQGAQHAESSSTAGAPAAAPVPGERKVLYWYDPMSPNTRFEKPGKSPFMDMQLIPKYADEDDAPGTLRIDPIVAQNLGVRLATVTRTAVSTEVLATGVVAFNERDVAVVQARTGGFVERVAPLAPGDVVAAGATVAELLVPEWAAVQQEYLALRQIGQAALAEAAVERMRLAGMPEELVGRVVQSGTVRNYFAVTAPIAGVVRELEVRRGMTLSAGATLLRINGIGTVWLDVAVPEAQAGPVRIGQKASVQFPALPGETLHGRISALLPSIDEAARALRVRVELPNPGGRLRPGLSAQVRLQSLAMSPALAVPTESVIRTGQRAVVMIAEEGGRYRPVEVGLGGEVGAMTQIVSGLSEGQRVVASGQFLIDSEASLKGVLAQNRDAAQAAPVALAASALHDAEAKVDAIDGNEITLTHGSFKSMNMPGMTMPFPLASEHVAHGIKPGDVVVVSVRQTPAGLVVERIEKRGGTK